MKKITKYHYNAPLTIAIGFVPGEAWIRESDQKDMGIVDASIAATSVWFEAADLGLGCVWVSAFDVDAQKKTFPEMQECEMVAFMQIGYPDPTGKAAKWHSDKKERSEMFFNGLDTDGVTEIRKLLLELKSQGKTMLVVSHMEEDIHVLCDRVINLNHGKMVASQISLVN